MQNIPYQPIYQFTRGETVESIHFGSIAVVTPDNQLVAWYGDPDVVTFLRSSAKPFQAMPFIERKGHEVYNFTKEEVALICASHKGTDRHKKVLESIQSKTGVLESDLQCGVHRPSDPATSEAMRQRGEEPTPNRHNCSGKHTGMIAAARLRNLEYRESKNPYIDPDHPIQKEIKQTFAEMCGIDVDQVKIGTDGCSAPNFAVPLRAAALAYARLSDPSGLPAKRQAACRVIAESMMAYPFMVGGPTSFDTALMETADGKVLCKGGAEGYQGIAVMPGVISSDSPGIGITFKISDGDRRGQTRHAVALEILRQLNILDETELSRLSSFGPKLSVTNSREKIVGQGSPIFTLERAEIFQ
jgi:L-asparaginase II